MAPNTPRRLDEALRPGGLYYTADGTAHDANGNVLEGAPERPKDTPVEEQPHNKMAAAFSGSGGTAGGVGATMDVERLGAAIAVGLRSAAGGAQNAEAVATSQTAHDELVDGAKEAKPKENTPPIVDAARGPAPLMRAPGETDEAFEERSRVVRESAAGGTSEPTS